MQRGKGEALALHPSEAWNKQGIRFNPWQLELKGSEMDSDVKSHTMVRDPGLLSSGIPLAPYHRAGLMH